MSAVICWPLDVVSVEPELSLRAGGASAELHPVMAALAQSSTNPSELNFIVALLFPRDRMNNSSKLINRTKLGRWPRWGAASQAWECCPNARPADAARNKA